MPRLLIGWLLQTCAHGRQVQEVIVLPAHNNPRSTSGEEIDKRSGIAIQAVQTRQDMGEGKGKRAGIAADRCSGSQQFPPVIAIACVAERAQLCGIKTDMSRVIELAHPFPLGFLLSAVFPVQPCAF